MRVLLAAFLLFASCASAAAQGCGSTNPNCIVPTAPAGTSDNRAASTAFVQSSASGSAVKGPASSTVGDIPSWNNTAGTLLSDPTNITSNAQDFYFGTGRPWCDVRAKGAVGNGSTDDSAAFKSCRVTLDALGGGVMYVPPGNYCLETVDSHNAVIAISATPITVIGAGINVSNLWTCGADVTIGYANINGAGFQNLSYLAKGGQGNPNDTTFGATSPAFKFDTSCGLCRIYFVRGFGGLYALDNLGFDTFLSDWSFGYAYGQAIIHEAGSGHRLVHGSIDQSWPVVLPNQNSVTISAWQSSHTYTGNGASNTNVVSTQGYNIQLVSASCTSGGSAPTLKNYGTAITDGTCSWQLVGNTTYYGDDCDGNCVELVLHGEVDLNCGGCTHAFAMTNNNSGSAPLIVEIEGASIGQSVVAPIGLLAGSGFALSNSHVSTSVQAAAQGLYVPASGFTGDASIVGNRFSGVGTGGCIAIGTLPSGEAGYTITSNRFLSCTTAINFFGAAGAVHITAGHNTMIAVTTALTVPGGSSFYEFTNNDINGAAVSFTASDASQCVGGNDGSSYPVNCGGSGAATLTGIVVGHGASAMTATQVTGAVKDNGSGTLSQAACADLSNAATSCSTDATNATNISSGTLSGSRMSAVNLAAGNVNGGVTGTLPIINGGTGLSTGSPRITGPATNVNFASSGDNAINTPLPSGYTQLCALQIFISGASGNISTATYGLFTATGGSGTIIASGATISITTGAANSNNNFMQVNATNIATEAYTPTSGQIFFRVGTTVSQTANVQANYAPCP